MSAFLASHRRCRRLVWCETTATQPLKTETGLMWFGSATALRNLPSSVRAVNVPHVGSDVQPASVVRDLSVKLDGEQGPI